MQTLFFIGCLLHDIMKILNGPNWLKIGSKFQMLLSGSFAALILPTGIVSISYLFWPVILSSYVTGYNTKICYHLLNTYLYFTHKNSFCSRMSLCVAISYFSNFSGGRKNEIYNQIKLFIDDEIVMLWKI